GSRDILNSERQRVGFSEHLEKSPGPLHSIEVTLQTLKAPHLLIPLRGSTELLNHLRPGSTDFTERRQTSVLHRRIQAPDKFPPAPAPHLRHQLRSRIEGSPEPGTTPSWDFRRRGQLTRCTPGRRR
ncbi:hypothetical protein JYU34_022897, partial [Plutella xylostella]